MLSFSHKKVKSEDFGSTESVGYTEWRHLVNSAVSVMKMFDLYEWLMRWLSHDQPGMRLLVFMALGLLGYPLLETKQKFDPIRKACCLVSYFSGECSVLCCDMLYGVLCVLCCDMVWCAEYGGV